MMTTCKKCGFSWDFTGKDPYATCLNCRARFKARPLTEEEHQKELELQRIYREKNRDKFRGYDQKRKTKKHEYNWWYQKQYYKKNKKRISQRNKVYHSKHQNLRIYSEMWRKELFDVWGQKKCPPSETKKIGNISEQLAQKILGKRGYDILKMTPNFPFDFLVKKDGNISAVEVSTYPRKTISNWLKEFLTFLDIDIIFLFIKPNLKEYWMMILPEKQRCISVPKNIIVNGATKTEV